MSRHVNSNRDAKIRKEYDKKYFGNYLGIVIQNNDPEKRGRVKVYIPHISASIYENWYKVPVDKSFSFIGKNIDSDLTDIIDDLKEILPWGDCAAPLMGATGTGRYNARLEKGFISDSSKVETTTTNTSTEFTKYGLNKDGTGEKPARIYEVKELEVSDGFSTTVGDISGAGVPNRVNKYSFQYKPSSYSNQSKGSFSIPNVGSHVWVFFQGGDPMVPIYFATSYGSTDWRDIYEAGDDDHGIDYPGSYENVSRSDDSSYNHNTETYRNKYVFNQKGGAIEIVNTDNREILKLTHYSGSFKEFNNEANIELATGQDQKLVQGDQFCTVNGHKSECVQMDYDKIIRGDHYKKIGTFNYDKFTDWQDNVRFISDLKQLFEVKRAEYLDDENVYFQKVSPIQSKTPQGKEGHSLCPVCSHPDRPKFWEVKNEGLTLRLPSIATIATAGLDLMAGFILPLGLPSPFDFAQPPVSPGNFLGSGSCPCCGGDGRSPSTFGGIFENQDKDALITEEIKSRIGKLTEIERELGLGGSELVNITKHKVENIGLLMNDFPSVRIDSKGKLVPSEVIVLKEGVILNQSASPLVEYVHVDEMPGGSYTLNCANKFNVQAGANGISFKSYGPVDIGGTIVNVGGEQVNIASENEININANRVSIVADILSMRQRQYKQVVIESNLGVAGNAVIRGSLHVEGELSLQHVTAPMEMRQTDGTIAFGTTTPTRIGTAYIAGGSSAGLHPVYGGGASPMSVEVYDHGHTYESIPMSPVKTSDDVRIIGQNTAARIETAPQPVANGNFIQKGLDKLGEKLDGAVESFEL